jgi:geranylgeranyl pyrophosphate synthase
MGGKIETALPASAAVEFIGASARSFFEANENLRVENEATKTSGILEETNLAILCGIALLNAAYDLVFVEHNVLPERAMRAHAEIVECVGTSRIFGSIPASNLPTETAASNSGSSNEREAALIRLAVRLGAVLSGANYLELDALSRFAGRFSDALATRKALTGDETIGEVSSAMSNIRAKDSADQAKLILIENFPSSPARSLLIQLVDHYTGA